MRRLSSNDGRRLALLTAALLVPAASATDYTFTLVDAFTPNYGLRECYLYDINDDGMACGTATIEIRWSGGTMITYTGFTWTPDGGKTPADISWPHGLNQTGLVAGVSALFDLNTRQPTTVPLLPNTYMPLILNDVNDAGVAVGSVQICNCSNSQGFLQIPYVWDAASGPRTLPVPGANGLARITNSGLVVGWIGGNMQTNSFLYDLESGQYTLMSDVFSSPNIQTTATDVTEDGVVVGARRENNGNVTYGYTWSPATGVALLPLPPAGFQPHVRPTSLNRSGVIVGSIYDMSGSSRAFVYDEAHGIRDLNTVSDAPSTFTMITAVRVNSAGWIAGYGYGGGGMYKGYVLRPIVAGDIDRDGDVDLSDLTLLLSSFGACSGDANFAAAADFDGSGCVELADLAVLLANFGA